MCGCSSNEISFAQIPLTITSCIHKGLHVGKWPDLLTAKPDALSTLEYHWTDYIGTTMADAIAQWSSSGNSSVNLHNWNWNTLEDHWSHKYTGMPLEPHWLMLAPSGIPVAISRENLCCRCLFGGDSSHITTLANMTFKQIFLCKLLIDYVLFWFTKEEK